MSCTVLLVEGDEARVRALLDAVAERGLAWHIEVADSLLTARFALERGQYDVVLVRQSLPDGSALELKGELFGRPAILCVAPGEESAAAQAIGQGFSDCLMLAPHEAFLALLEVKVQSVLSQAQTQARLREVTQQFDLAMTHADLGWWVRDIHGDALSLSDRACSMLGYAANEVAWTLQLWRQKIHPEDLERVRAAIEAHRGGLTDFFRCEYRLLHKGGHWVWVLTYGRILQGVQARQPLRLFGTVMDISVMRESEDRLRDTATLLAKKSHMIEAAFGSISQGVLQIGAQGEIVTFNQRFCELLDLPDVLMSGVQNIREIFQFQLERGDFGDEYSLAFPGARQHLATEFQTGGLSRTDLPANYWRKTRQGQYLEIKTLSLPDGGWVRTFADVTSYFEAKQALSESEERFRRLTELSSDWYWEMDEQFCFVRFDGYDKHKAGVPEVEVLGRPRWDLGAINMSQADWEAHKATLEAHQSFRNLELNRIDADGENYWVTVSGVPIFDATDRFCGYRGVGQNITDRKRAEQATENLAFYDPLTGLPNRRLMLNRLHQALESTARQQGAGALLFIDLDNFKTLNDTRGHDTGDALLRQVAQRLSDSVRAIDTVSRLGGDEFVVMLEGLGSDLSEATARAQAVSDKILAAFHAPFLIAGHLHLSSPSIGVTLFAEKDHSVDELLKQADLAMYQAKAAGRNTMRFFDPDMQIAVTERAEMESDLRIALNQDQVVLYFQPVVDHTGKVCGAEALVRWEHVQRGLILPGDFIAIAEQTGLILNLGQRVLHLACERLAAWSTNPRMAHLNLSVNVSARQLRQADFAQQVVSILERTGAPASRLKLELTESMLLNDVEDTIEKMTFLRSQGVGFSLDDFGTGYSSLAYLKRLPLEQLKIDQSFVRDVLIDANDASIARTIVTLAQCLGLNVIAEGVETVGQHQFLLDAGCLTFQGFLFGAAAPETVLLRRLQEAVAAATA